MKDILIVQGIHFGLKILGALALWFVGVWLIRVLVRITERALKLKGVDVTVGSYVGTAISVLLKIILAGRSRLAILSQQAEQRVMLKRLDCSQQQSKLLITF